MPSLQLMAIKNYRGSLVLYRLGHFQTEAIVAEAKVWSVAEIIETNHSQIQTPMFADVFNSRQRITWIFS